MYTHNLHPQRISTTYIHDVHPQRMSTTHIHNAHPQRTPTQVFTGLNDYASDGEIDDWRRLMPGWLTQRKSRGLLGWGLSRKRGKIIRKAGCVPELCRAPLMEALDFYFNSVGLPPVVAGESAKKAIKEGRISREDTPTKRPKGMTKKQIVLIPLLSGPGT